MGFLFFILVFLCWYFWNKNIRLNKKNSELIKKLKEERARLDPRTSVKEKQQILKSREKETPKKKSVVLDYSESDTAVKTFIPSKFTSRILSILETAIEKPHWGASGVPFINKHTSLLSIWL